jgi:hypothetical protein
VAVLTTTADVPFGGIAQHLSIDARSLPKHSAN